MTKRDLTITDPVRVAIDVAKHRCEVLIDVPGKRRQRRTVLSQRAEHERLIADLTALNRPIEVGFEATGDYHRTMAYRLLQAGFTVRLISSVALARTREALCNGWDSRKGPWLKAA